MLKNIKAEVQERLKKQNNTRLSMINYDLDTNGNPLDMKKYFQAKVEREKSQKDLQKDFEVLDMLEQMEQIHPDALKIFYNEACKKGIYKRKQMNKSEYHSANRSPKVSYFQSQKKS